MHSLAAWSTRAVLGSVALVGLAACAQSRGDSPDGVHDGGSAADAFVLPDAALPEGGEAGTPPPYESFQATTGWQVYPDGSYHYGPSILVDTDGTIHMWTCSPGTNGAWDYVRYHHSTDGGHTWSADTVALQPTPATTDAYSACDPGVVKVGPYFYIGYTSTTNSAGTQNDVFIARSTAPTGPFEKWGGAGWGNDPKPILTYGGNSTYYGYGEPSLVLLGKKLFVYYSDDQATQYTNVATVDDATADDWPSHLVDHGHAITRDRAAQDSADVKYVDARGVFVAVTTVDRFSPNASIAAYQSSDGLTFEPIPYRGARVQIGAHNVGLSGDMSGHIGPTTPTFVSYAYQPAANGWGNWPTFLDPIALMASTRGTPVAGGVSSIVGGNDWNWSGPRAWDGEPTSVYSSLAHGATDVANEWVWVDLGATLPLKGVTVVPRPGGLGFPVDFSLQTSLDGATWTDVPGQSYTGYVNPGSTDVTFPFAATPARYVRLNATRLGNDGTNTYLQLAELEPVIGP